MRFWQVERAVRGSGPLLEKIAEPIRPSPLQPMNHEERMVAISTAPDSPGTASHGYRREWLNAMAFAAQRTARHSQAASGCASEAA